MIQLFYESAKRAKAKSRPWWKVWYKVCKVLVNLLFPVSQLFKRSYGLDQNSRIIVSLTTYPARIDSVWVCIASLLQQTCKPCRVILWLAKEQFPNHEIPIRLERLKKRGLEIRFCEDLKPHKKYYDVMKEYPDYHIVTADDDILYPENHIEQLWKEHEIHPHAVICHWSHRIGLDEQGAFLPYNEWEDNARSAPAYATLAVGCNGVLYPPRALPDKAFDRQAIREYALYTDDLWLKCMEILNGYKTVNCNEAVLIYFNKLSTMKSGLWKSNTGQEGKNDVSWKKLVQKYPEVVEKLMEEK